MLEGKGIETGNAGFSVCFTLELMGSGSFLFGMGDKRYDLSFRFQG